MKAVRLHGPRDLRHEDHAPPPDPRAGEVVMAVGAVGICGSDLHMHETGGIGGAQASQPVILGHEFAGTIIATGQDPLPLVGPPLEVNDRVAVDPAIACGDCESCREGHPNLCGHHTFHGVPPDDGALCDYLRVPAKNCFRLPDAISDAGGALLEPLGVAIHAMDLGKLRNTDTVALFGAGPVGLLMLSLCCLSGLGGIHVFDPVASRRAKALALGATAAWDVPADADPATVVAPLLEATQGRGVDVGFEVADAGRSVDQTFAAMRAGGRVVLVGIPARDRTEFGHALPRRKGLTVRFSRRMKHTYPRALALQQHPLMAGVMEGLVSHRFALADTKAAFELAESQANDVLKTMVYPGSVPAETT